MIWLTHIDTAIQSVARFPMRGLRGFIIAMYLKAEIAEKGCSTIMASVLPAYQMIEEDF